MTDPNFTHITIVQDRSGSMSVIRSDMEAALRMFIDDQRHIPGKCLVSLHQFDDEYETVFEHLDINAVPSYELIPRRSTALLDAMGYSITRTGEYLKSLPEDERPGKVLFIVITDGLENSSKVYTRQQIFEMVKEQEEKYNWQFVYMGAHVDSFAEAGGLGIGSSLRSANTGASVYAAMAATSEATTRYRTDQQTRSGSFYEESETDHQS